MDLKTLFRRHKDEPIETTQEETPTEDRQNPPAGTYTDAIVETILATAAGGNTNVSPLVTSAVEIAASMYSRALSSASVTGDAGLLKPHILSDIGRDLIRYGESLWYPYTSIQPRFTELLHSHSWDVTGGGISPRTWKYNMSFATPDGDKDDPFKKTVDQDAVFHFKFSTEASQPWKGVAPLQWASNTGKFMAIVENVLRDESAGTRGYILPVSGLADAAVEKLKTDLGDLRGKTTLMGTPFASYGNQRHPGGTYREFYPSRIGPDYPEQVVTLYQNLTASIVMACGVPINLIHPQEATGLREAWRQFLHGSVAPIASMIQEEMSKKLRRSVTLDFTELYAADVQGRARAFNALVSGNMSVTDAAEKTGFGKVQEYIRNDTSPSQDRN